MTPPSDNPPLTPASVPDQPAAVPAQAGTPGTRAVGTVSVLTEAEVEDAEGDRTVAIGLQGADVERVPTARRGRLGRLAGR